MTKVIIGIQARSTSTRLPNKCFEMIGNRNILDHVIASALIAERYVNNFTRKHGVETQTMLLVPKGDPLIPRFRRSCPIFEGSEPDVLDRYYQAMVTFGCDYMVRITGDCPLLPSNIISKHIKVGINNDYDYLSNVDDRLSIDGVDCEFISSRLLGWLHETATKPYDREHVTTYARSNKPDWASYGAFQGFFDLSNIKLSVDTPEDLERVRAEYNKIFSKINNLEARYGRSAVHRY